MNNKKIAFIICVNNELYFEECSWYLNRLTLPEGFEIDIITIREATSMTEAYNAAMESSDAKYKVYLHQDVFIINQNFISDMVNVFSADDKIGLMGLIGGVKLPEDGIIYDKWNCGRAIACDWLLPVDVCFYQKEPYSLVEALDGMLLATQHDVRWREDILKQWDYYDISQSFEFIKAGYHIVIPYQNTAWAIHDCGYSNLMHYDENRKIMFKAYPEFFSGSWEIHPFKHSYELQTLTRQLYKEIENLINQGRHLEAETLLNSFDENRMDKNILLLRHIFAISNMEKKIVDEPRLLDLGLSTSELLDRYSRVKFFLRRLDIGETSELKNILNWIHGNKVSPMEITICTIHNLIHRKYVFALIEKAYRLGNEFDNEKIMKDMPKNIEGRNLSITKDDQEFISKRRMEAEYWSNKLDLP